MKTLFRIIAIVPLAVVVTILTLFCIATGNIRYLEIVNEIIALVWN